MQLLLVQGMQSGKVPGFLNKSETKPTFKRPLKVLHNDPIKC
jgi:hypothetical protein